MYIYVLYIHTVYEIVPLFLSPLLWGSGSLSKRGFPTKKQLTDLGIFILDTLKKTLTENKAGFSIGCEINFPRTGMESSIFSIIVHFYRVYERKIHSVSL
jgi:hypothetical protein